MIKRALWIFLGVSALAFAGEAVHLVMQQKASSPPPKMDLKSTQGFRRIDPLTLKSIRSLAKTFTPTSPNHPIIQAQSELVAIHEAVQTYSKSKGLARLQLIGLQKNLKNTLASLQKNTSPTARSLMLQIQSTLKSLNTLLSNGSTSGSALESLQQLTANWSLEDSDPLKSGPRLLAPQVVLHFPKLPDSLSELFTNSQSGLAWLQGRTDPHACQAIEALDPKDTKTSQTATDLFTARTPTVLSLAHQLGSAQAAFFYVRDQIRFLPRFGAIQTASESLTSGAGTAADKATTLIALYRALGIPAQYLAGEILVPEADLKNLYGVASARDLFWAQSVLLPKYFLATQGSLDPSRMVFYFQGKRVWALPHVWVNAYLNGRWTQVDPAWALQNYSQGTLTESAVQDNLVQFLFGADSSGAIIKTQTLADVLMNQAGADINSIGLVSQGISVTPESSIPVGPLGMNKPCIQTQADLIPDEYQFKSVIKLEMASVSSSPSPNALLLQATIPLAQATQDALYVIHSAGLLGDGAQGPGKLSLVSGSTTLATSPAVDSSTAIQIDHAIQEPSRYGATLEERITPGLQAGGVAVISHAIAPSTEDSVDSEINILRALGPQASHQIEMAHLLKLAATLGLVRGSENDRDINLLRGINRFSENLMVTSTMTGTVVNQAGSMLGVIPVGTAIDWDVAGPIYSKTGNYSSFSQYSNIAQAKGEVVVADSSVENQIWEELYGTGSISAVKVLQSAAAGNIINQALHPNQPPMDLIKGDLLNTQNAPALFARMQAGMQPEIPFLQGFVAEAPYFYSLTDSLTLATGWSGIGFVIFPSDPTSRAGAFVGVSSSALLLGSFSSIGTSEFCYEPETCNLGGTATEPNTCSYDFLSANQTLQFDPPNTTFGLLDCTLDNCEILGCTNYGPPVTFDPNPADWNGCPTGDYFSFQASDPNSINSNSAVVTEVPDSTSPSGLDCSVETVSFVNGSATDSTTTYPIDLNGTVISSSGGGTTGGGPGTGPQDPPVLAANPPSTPVDSTGQTLGSTSPSNSDGTPNNSKNPTNGCAGSVGQPVNVSSGAMWHSLEDFNVPGRTPTTALKFQRTYVSEAASPAGDFGPNWKHNWETRLFSRPAGNPSGASPSPRPNLVWIDETDGPWTFTRQTDGTLASPPGLFATLTEFTDHYELKKKGGTKLFFSRGGFGAAPIGALTSLVEPRGEAVTLSYDANGKLQSISTGLAGTITFSRDTSGRVTSVTRVRDNLTYTYTYNPQGKLASSADFDNNVTTYQYITNQPGSYAQGMLSQITDPLGRSITFTYYSNGKAFEQTEPGNAYRTFVYSAAGSPELVTRVRDVDGNTLSFTLDAQGRTTQITYPDGSRTQRVWNSLNELTSSVDELGFSTLFTYDLRGNVASLKFPADPAPAQFSYDPNFDRLTQVIPLAGSPTQISINPNTSDITQIQRADNQGNLSLQFTYDPFGNVLVTNNGLASYSNVTDANGLQTTVFDARNPEQRSYDNRGRLVTRSFASGRTISYTYDNHDRVTRIDDTAGPSTVNTYDVMGRLLSATKTDGTTAETTQYQWDDRDRLIAIIDPLGRKTQIQYHTIAVGCHVVDKPSQITDPAGHSTQMEYDSRQRLIRQIDANGGVTRYEYNFRGDLTALTDPSGNRTQFFYDGNNRLVKRERPSVLTGQDGKAVAATEITDYVYDAAGRLLKRRETLCLEWSDPGYPADV